jgi:hypothetical protein
MRGPHRPAEPRAQGSPSAEPSHLRWIISRARSRCRPHKHRALAKPSRAPAHTRVPTHGRMSTHSRDPTVRANRSGVLRRPPCLDPSSCRVMWSTTHGPALPGTELSPSYLLILLGNHMCVRRCIPPISNSGFITVDTGNCSPRHMRVTMCAPPGL